MEIMVIPRRSLCAVPRASAAPSFWGGRAVRTAGSVPIPEIGSYRGQAVTGNALSWACSLLTQQAPGQPPDVNGDPRNPKSHLWITAEAQSKS